MVLKELPNKEDVVDYGIDETVYVSQSSEYSGAEKPIGQPSHPVNNIDDAIQIANERNLPKIFIKDGEFSRDDAPTKGFTDLHVTGHNVDSHKLDLNGVDVTGAFFEHVNLYGECVGSFLEGRNCVLGFEGDLINTDSYGVIAMVDSLVHSEGNHEAVIVEYWRCYSDNAMTEDNFPYIKAQAVQLIGCHGQFEIECTGSTFDLYYKSFISLVDGVLKINSESTNSHYFNIYGNTEVINQSLSNMNYWNLQNREKGLDNIHDNIVMDEETGTATYGDAGGEQDIFNIDFTVLSDVSNFKLDLSNLTQSGTWRLYVDGVKVREESWNADEDSDTVLIKFDMITSEELNLTWEEDADEGADRGIPYAVRWRGE